MLMFHGGDGCRAAGISLLQQVLPQLVEILPTVANPEEKQDREAGKYLDVFSVEQALLYMKQARFVAY